MAKKTMDQLTAELEAAQKAERIERLKAQKKQLMDDIQQRKDMLAKSGKEQERLRGLLVKLTEIVESDEFNPVRRTY
jgi:uncharacterized protein (UPF0335 family)